MFISAGILGLLMFGGLALLPSFEEPITEDDYIEDEDNDDYENVAIHASADVVMGSFLNDMMDGSDDMDRMHGYNGDDTLIGGDGSDSLFGGEGNDELHGRDAFTDYLNGGAGNDVIHSGVGDVVTSGDSMDTIHHQIDLQQNQRIAQIMDFNPDQDHLVIEVSGDTQPTVSISQTAPTGYSILVNDTPYLMVHSTEPITVDMITLRST